jgi:hypothetical protein
MGRDLHVQVFVNDYHNERLDEIAAIVEPYDELKNGDDLTTDGMVGFYGGRSPETFTKDLTHAIWKANGGYCDVVVRVDEPMEYSLTDDDYERFTAEQPEGWEYEEDEWEYEEDEEEVLA